jgi:rare lipoprotein A
MEMKTNKEAKDKGRRGARDPLSRQQSTSHRERALAALENGIGYRGLHEVDLTRRRFEVNDRCLPRGGLGRRALKSAQNLGERSTIQCSCFFAARLGISPPMFRWILAFLIFCLLAGCGGGDYSGYNYRPYTMRGQRYAPMSPGQAPGYIEEGVASHYREGWMFFPGPTSLGEDNWPWSRGGAHKTLPLPCRVRVTNLRNGRSTIIRLNDRGPFVAGRTLDVTEPVAKQLGFYDAGLAPVRIEVLSVGDGKWRVTRPLIPRAIPLSSPQRP